MKVCIARNSLGCGRKGKRAKVAHHVVNKCRNHCSCRYQIDLLTLPDQYAELNVVRRFN